MNASVQIAVERLRTQGITHPVRGASADIVRRLLAVQAQDYLGAKWGIGLRLRGATEAAVDRAVNTAEIVRTHVLRPTWHFVLAEDIRWLLALTGPRVLALNAPMSRKLGLGTAVEGAGVRLAEGQRLAYIVMHAEQIALICNGPRRGRQFTYALMDERVPATDPLARRYFAGHGREHFFDPNVRPRGRANRRGHLLCIYDEYIAGYRYRSGIITEANARTITGRGAAVTNVLLIDTEVLGTWTRAFTKDATEITLEPFGRLSRLQRGLLDEAADAFGAFMGLAPRDRIA